MYHELHMLAWECFVRLLWNLQLSHAVRTLIKTTDARTGGFSHKGLDRNTLGFVQAEVIFIGDYCII